MRRLALLLVLLAASAARSEEARPAAEEALRFAQSLFDEKDYYRAITEFKRVAFLAAPGTPLERQARLGIGLSYQAGGKWDPAVEAFRLLSDGKIRDAFSARAALELGEIWRVMGEDVRAEQAYRAFLKDYPSSPDAARARRALAGCLVRLTRLKEAEEILKDDAGAGAARDSLEHPGDLSPKSPGLAGTLSAVLPGSGQWYAGRPVGGAAYFLATGALALTSAESYRTDRPALGALLLLGAVTAYASNIYGAVGDAHKANREAAEDYAGRIQDTLIPPSAAGRGAGLDRPGAPLLALGWTIRF